MKNVVILAAGPPKPGRNRHLEKVNEAPLIDSVINASHDSGDKIFVVVESANYDLQRHLERIEFVDILVPKSRKIVDTFDVALGVTGDVIMVCGDLRNLSKSDIKKFRDTQYSCAICRYARPWGQNIVSYSGRIRRADVGDCINLISECKKEEFLSAGLNKSARELFADFNPATELDEYIYNDIGTFTSYAFYRDIWGNPSVDEAEGKGTILYEHPVYLDND
jgi:GTP:adenosylcobinamide-phosphate guanylyltransferase